MSKISPLKKRPKRAMIERRCAQILRVQHFHRRQLMAQVFHVNLDDAVAHDRAGSVCARHTP